MRWSNQNCGCTNAVCEHFETCSKIYRNAEGRSIPFKSQRRCFEMCADFRQGTCADLVQDCSRRRRISARELAVTKTDAKCRVNRTYEDYLSFLALNFGVQTVEPDTVIGSVGGEVLFTPRTSSSTRSSSGRSSSRRRTAPSSAGTESPCERTEAASRTRR